MVDDTFSPFLLCSSEVLLDVDTASDVLGADSLLTPLSVVVGGVFCPSVATCVGFPKSPVVPNELAVCPNSPVSPVAD